MTPLPVYMASIVAGRFPYIRVSAEVGCSGSILVAPLQGQFLKVPKQSESWVERY